MIPSISVVMSVFNGEKHLKESIESILGQSYSDFEFIIIDDASTDNSLKIIEDYRGRDSRIKLIRNKNNIGLTKSLNIGINSTVGKIIARQDADDISLPDRLKEQVYLMNSNNCALVGSWVIKINGSGGKTENIIYSNSNLRDKFKNWNYFTHGSACFLKEAYNSIGGYRAGFEFSQDYDLFSRMIEKYNAGYVNKFLYKWRNNQDGISSKKATRQFVNAVLIKCFIYERNRDGSDSYHKFLEKGLEGFLNDYKYRDLYYFYLGKVLFSQKYYDASRACFWKVRGFPQKSIYIFLSYLGKGARGLLPRGGRF